METALLNTIQEITLQAYSFGIYNILQDDKDMSRDEVFSLFRDWAEEFENLHKDTDWAENFYYDEIDEFLADKKDELTHKHKEGEYIRLENKFFLISGICEDGYLVKDLFCTDKGKETTIISFNKDNDIVELDDYDEVISSWGDAHDATLRNKINHAWNLNRAGFAPILVALYTRDIDEITDHDAFQYKDWIDTDEYHNGRVTGCWAEYNIMALEKMEAEWDFYATNYLDHIADDCDLECILDFLHYPYLPCYLPGYKK